MDEIKKEEDELEEEDEEIDDDLDDNFDSGDNKPSSESHDHKDHDHSHEDHKQDHDHHDHHLDKDDHHDHHDHKHDHDSDHSHDDKKHDHQAHHDPISSFQSSGSGFQDKSDDNSIKIKKDDLWKYAKVVILAFIILGAFAYFRGPVGVTGDVVGEQPTQLPPAGGQVEVSADDDPFKGDENAPVTIIEFSDYECPFCGRFYSQTLPQLDSEYIKTGKVKFVYRDFPLSSIHPQAQKAAEAAECARKQGGDEVYFNYHDGLFDNGVQGGVASFKQLAADLGLDTNEFNECLDSGEMASEVAKDLADGSSYGVTGTPAFFVNGKLISGAQPFSAFQAAIEAELA